MSGDHSVDWYSSGTPERLTKTPAKCRAVALLTSQLFGRNRKSRLGAPGAIQRLRHRPPLQDAVFIAVLGHRPTENSNAFCYQRSHTLCKWGFAASRSLNEASWKVTCDLYSSMRNSQRAPPNQVSIRGSRGFFKTCSYCNKSSGEKQQKITSAIGECSDRLSWTVLTAMRAARSIG